MKKILYKFIACLLIPSFVFAQPYPYRSIEKSIQQTDLSRLWAALNTDVGQQIISYTETTVGRIKLEQAKAFTTAEGEIAFVPIKSFSKVLVALCYRQLKDGSEYLFLITYNAAEKGVSVMFPSGRAFTMNSSGTKESFTPDFQFQPYDDLNNKVGIIESAFSSNIIGIICVPALIIIMRVGIFLDSVCNSPGCDWLIRFILLSAPFLFIVPAYLYENSNLEMISILALYYYGCLFVFSIFFHWPASFLTLQNKRG